MRLIDSHSHFDAAEFDGDRAAAHARALIAGVSRQIVPAVEAAGWPKLKQVCAEFPGLFPAYGLHPMYLPSHRPGHLHELREWIEREKPVAVGECGLDFFVEGLDAKTQAFYFDGQLQLAREFDLPVIVHVRRAVDDVLACLRRVRVRGGIAHAFNGSRQQAEQFIGLGFKLGFGGAMTYSGSTRIRRLAAELPLSALVLETDAPDIPPSWCPGGRCEPVFLARYAEELAALRGVDVATVRSVTSRNVVDVLSVAG